MSQRWRSIRYRLLPALVFGAATVLAVWLWRDHTRQSVSVVGMARGRVFQASATYGGRIESIPVRLFERVSKDQVLALMEDTLLVAQILTIRGEIGRLRAEYDRERSILRADIEDRRSKWVAEGRAFTGDVVDLKVGILELRSTLESDRALLKGLALEMENASRLVRDGALPEIESGRATAAHEALAAKIRANEGWLEQMEAERTAAEERAGNHPRHAPTLPSEETDLEHLRNAIRVQEGLIRELEVQRAERVLTAPFDGIVIEVQPRAGDALLRRPGEGVLRRVGEVVAPGEPIVAIAETSPSEIIAYVGEHQMNGFREGAVVEIMTRTRPARLGRSRAVAVAPTVERLPERLWTPPGVPAWGRPCLFSIPPGIKLAPGELVWVRQRSDDLRHRPLPVAQ